MERKQASYISIATALAMGTSAVAGGMWVGAIANEVDTLKEEKAKVTAIQENVQENSITLAEVQAKQEAMAKTQEKQDKKLDRILDKLEEL